MLDGKSLTTLDLDQYPQAVFENIMGKFNETNHNKAYAREYIKDDETETVTSRSRQLGRKIKSRKKQHLLQVSI